MKLNLGCADRYAPGWENVDHQAPFTVDQNVDLRGVLPWAELSIAHVYAGHILEHITVDDAINLLERLLPCMVYYGEIMVVGPDLNRAQVMAEAGTLDVTMDSLRHGANRWPGDTHEWECTPDILISMLETAGWGNIREIGIEKVSDFWPVADRRPLWQCAVTAKRAGA